MGTRQWDLPVLSYTVPLWSCWPERVTKLSVMVPAWKWYTRRMWYHLKESGMHSKSWLLYSAVFSIGKKTRAQKVEILMTLVTHFPSLLVTQSRKFCLPSPQLWVLWVYRWMAKVPLNFFFQDSCQGTSWEKEELQSWQGWWYLEETIENKKTLG